MKTILALIFVIFFTLASSGQDIFIDKGLKFNIPDHPGKCDIFSLIIDDTLFYSSEAEEILENEELFSYRFRMGERLIGSIIRDENFTAGIKFDLHLINSTEDTLALENVIPFGQSVDHIYITATGPWALARAKLFRPGKTPVSVILPDNAWEMGYCCPVHTDEGGVCAIARRDTVINGQKRRYKTNIYPGGSVNYSIYIDEYAGRWQNGLKAMFHDNILYELEDFDNTLFERKDLAWIRNEYLIFLQFAWDKEFYDYINGEYTIESFIKKGKAIFVGYDVYGLWPTWPRLGVDQRNQWDMFSSLPGGLEKIRQISRDMQAEGTKFFICYNPWDQSTRDEDPYQGMARLIEATDANGVVLDCHGWSSEKYQRAADSIKPGVIMYSEGMAVIEDMPGIVSGRVHNAIRMSPILNLNKVIKPEFGIFRVCELDDPCIHRELAIAFFNGYGTEINMFAPGRPESNDNDLVFLSKTTKLLRENTSNFLVDNWVPLISTRRDSIWVNHWPREYKDIYTVYSLIPGGHNGPLFKVPADPGFHLVSLWHHEEIKAVMLEGVQYANVMTNAFDRAFLGTRREGAIDCIARLPGIIGIEVKGTKLHITAGQGDELRVWKGNPSCQKNYMEFGSGSIALDLIEDLEHYEGKIVVELFEGGELLDERIIHHNPAWPYMISEISETELAGKAPANMVYIPGGDYVFKSSNEDNFIPYPHNDVEQVISLTPFYIDKYPVTNREFYSFLKKSAYKPRDTNNFLKHWVDGKYPDGLGDHPVVYVDLEDARAYAKWAGKRLPAEAEWQYAAQGKDERPWPWGVVFDSTRCNNASGSTTPVDKYPSGKSPFGVVDLTGNVWQLTNDVYDNGSYVFAIMKGGSFYEPASSWWYVQGGPQPVDKKQMLLLVSPSLNRNATVGFRCVVDAESIP